MIDAFNADLDLHRLLGQTIVNSRNREMNERVRALRALSPAAQATVLNTAERDLVANYVELNENVPLEEITADERQGAKSANFGLLYLQSPEGFRNYAESVYGVVLTEQEAVDFYNAFFEKWTGMREWHEETKRKVRRDGYIVSPIGRVRRLPGIWDSARYMQEEAERQAVNSPVQGLASDLMQMAAADIQGLLPGTKAVPRTRLVATVHDSVVAEVPIDGWEEACAEVVRRMENAGKWLLKLGVDFDVPIKADFTVGTRWSLDDISNPQ